MVASRRTVLGTSATIATILAGCTLGFGGTNETVGMAVRNDDDASHRVAVTVSFEGTTLVDRTYVLDPGDSARTSFENPDSAGSVRVDVAVPPDWQGMEMVRVGPGTGIRSISLVVPLGGGVEIRATRT